MNVQMENINVTQRDGRVTHLDRVYIRGSHVRLFIVPDMLRCEEKCCRSHEYLLTIFLQERAHVQISRHSWSRCWSRQRTRYRQPRPRPAWCSQISEERDS